MEKILVIYELHQIGHMDLPQQKAHFSEKASSSRTHCHKMFLLEKIITIIIMLTTGTPWPWELHIVNNVGVKVMM